MTPADRLASVGTMIAIYQSFQPHAPQPQHHDRTLLEQTAGIRRLHEALAYVTFTT